MAAALPSWASFSDMERAALDRNIMNIAELLLSAASKRTRATRARELADLLSDQEERREILRYADDLDRDAATLDAQIAVEKAEQI
jgi:hypothetical protein